MLIYIIILHTRKWNITKTEYIVLFLILFILLLLYHACIKYNIILCCVNKILAEVLWISKRSKFNEYVLFKYNINKHIKKKKRVEMIILSSRLVYSLYGFMLAHLRTLSILFPIYNSKRQFLLGWHYHWLYH